MNFLVTGTAGFIGFHLARRLLTDGHRVTGVDGFTPYYDVRLKRRRHQLLGEQPAFSGFEAMLEDAAALREIWAGARPDIVIHLAAQAGVRYSFERPDSYIGSNVVGTFNLLELARANLPRHLLVASTSSVYGANPDIPFSESDRTDEPLSIYAATKKATEVIGHSYSHLFSIPTTYFRFFTVYGPWGRPDMALFKFTKAILEDQPIDVYNHGDMSRDFTYVDDIVESIVRLVDAAPPLPSSAKPRDGASPIAPFRTVNIGNGSPVHLLDFIAALEQALGRKAKRNLLPMQPGDVPTTFASTELLERLTGFRPATPVDDGIRRFVDWYREHYHQQIVA